MRLEPQAETYDLGGWSSYRLEETIIEDLDRENINETVIVTLDDGQILFAVSKGVIL